MAEKWYAHSVEETVAALRTNAVNGLDRRAARSRLRSSGGNSFFFVGARSVFGCLRAVFADPMLLLLIGVTLIAAIFSEAGVAVASGIVIAVNVTVSAVFSIISQRRIESMAGYSQPKVRVIRNGELYLADARLVVPGDLILVGEGDILPCDARLVSAERLTVRVYTGEKDEEYVRVSPDASAIYAPDTVPPIEGRLNMLHAGTVVLSGEARAIAVETGEHTYIGALVGGMPLNDPTERPPMLKELKRFSRIYSFAALLMILPLTVVGIFTYGTPSMLRTFMLVLSLAVSSLGETVYVVGNVVMAAGFTFCASSGGAGGAMIKTPEALTDIASADRIFLLGDAALTDGRMRIVSVYADARELTGQDMFDGKPLSAAEGLVLTQTAAARYPSLGDRLGADLTEGTRDFCRRLGLDVKALGIRTEILGCSVNGGRVSTRVSDGGVIRTVEVTEDPSALTDCSYERADGGLSDFDVTKLYRASSAIDRMRDRGCRTPIVISVMPTGERILEGVFGFRTAICKTVPRRCRELADAGALPILVLHGEGKDSVALALDSGIVGSAAEIAFASECRRNSIPIPAAEGRYKAYLGFDRREVCELIERTRKAGHTVAVFGTDAGDFSAATCGDVIMTCDRADYSTGKDDIERLETAGVAGKGTSPDGAQVFRYYSDVLVKRAALREGGLDGIFNAVASARKINYNLRVAVKYLMTSQVLRLAYTVPTVLSGADVFSPVQMLISGLVVDACAMLVFASDRVCSATMRGTYRPVTLRDPLRTDRASLIAAAIAGLVGAIPALLLKLVGAREVGAAAFVGLVLTQYVTLFMMRAEGKTERGKLFTPVSLILTAASALPILILAPIGGISAVTGMTWSALSLILIPIVPAAFALSHFLLNLKKEKN